MPKNRVIYNTAALYTSQVSARAMQTGLGDILQISRVQSFNEDFTRNFTDINQYGDLASIDRLEVEAPEVTASFSYYLTNGFNEHSIGLFAAPIFFPSNNIVSCISGFLSKQTDEKNYYLLITEEGNDAAGYAGTNSGVIGIGNAYLTSYSINAAVGEIPTADVELEGLNIAVYKNIFGDVSNSPLPSINPELGIKLNNNYFRLPPAIPASGIPSALQPGDIIFTIPNSGTVGFEETDLKIQNFTLSLDLNRTPINKIGSRFAFSREIDFPVTTNLELTAEVGDLRSGSLVEALCDKKTQNFIIQMKQPGCGINKPTLLSFEFKGAKLTSQSFSSSIGDNASMTASYEIQLGGIQEKSQGVFISGSYYEDCPTLGNRPHFAIGGYSISPNNGGKYASLDYAPQTWKFNGNVFPLLTTSTFVASGDVRSTFGPAAWATNTSFRSYPNTLFTGWSSNPNTGWLEFSPGSFIAITRSAFNSFPIQWYSSSKDPRTFSASEESSFSSPVFNTFTMLHTSGSPFFNTCKETGSLAPVVGGATNDSLIGYLPINDRYLFISAGSSSFTPASLTVSGSTSGYYNISPSLDGSCSNTDFRIFYS